MIQPDPDDATGKSFKLDMKSNGTVPKEIGPGAKVKVGGPVQ